MSSMEPFDLGHEVSRLISLHSDLAGTTLRGACSPRSRASATNTTSISMSVWTPPPKWPPRK